MALGEEFISCKPLKLLKPETPLNPLKPLETPLNPENPLETL